jgi:hypothetical protein
MGFFALPTPKLLMNPCGHRPNSFDIVSRVWPPGALTDYRRSDAMNACPAPVQELSSVLLASPLPQLRRLVVTANEREVVITGRVSSYYMKQLAQEAIRPTLGDRRLLNKVEVCPN